MEPNVLLEGISSGTAEVQHSECSFPTKDAQGNPVVLATTGPCIYYKEATSKIVSLSALLSA
eukprot:3721757-Rhodomonas_salina.1